MINVSGLEIINDAAELVRSGCCDSCRNLDMRRVMVLVLGDLGRSPRMQNHVHSLLLSNCSVDFIGYNESKLPSKLLSNANLRIHGLPAFQIQSFFGVPRFLWLPFWLVFKTVALIISLLYLSIRLPRANLILCQLPPAIPTLLIMPVINWMHGAVLVYDWHNLGFSMMALQLGNNSVMVRLAKFIEKSTGRLASQHLAVSLAMKEWLIKHYGIESSNITVCYDRPNELFEKLGIDSAHEIWEKLVTLGILPSNDVTLSTDGRIVYKPDRPAVLISSTSWTADEDFGMLIDAILKCEKMICQENLSFPKVRLMVTGKGPLRSHYESLFTKLDSKHFTLLTLWLPLELYPKLLGAADLGICLHKSSSGIDLPMKIVDMLGCGLPVCAYDYPALEELLRAGENGAVFGFSQQLADHLLELLRGFPNKTARLQEMAAHVSNSPMTSWHRHWQDTAGPFLLSANQATRAEE